MKKFILLLLTLSLIGVPNVFAAEKIEGTYDAAEESKALMTALGIEEPASKTVTRAEFTRALMVLLNASGGSGNTGFADVSNGTDTAFAVEAATDRGIVSEDELFYPDRAVTYNEAYKMLVCALGYNAYLGSGEQYPDGYNKMASDLDLNKNISALTTAPVGVDEMYILLGNAANCAILVPDYESANKVTYDDSESLLEYIYDITVIDGIYEANEYTYLSDERQSLGEGRIIIGGTECGGTLPGIPLGSSLRAYIRDNDGELELVSATERYNTRMIIYPEDEPEYSDGTLVYYENSAKKRISIDTASLSVVYNGKAVWNAGESDIAVSDGYILALDNDKDGEYEVVHINEAEYMVVGSVSSDVIYDANSHGKIDLSDNNTVCVTDTGTDAEDLESGACIEYYASRDGSYIEVYTVSDKVEGTVTSINKTDNTVTIDGSEYHMTEYFRNLYSAQLAAGSEYKFLVSRSGRLVTIDGAESEQMAYGYCYKTYSDDEAGGETKMVKLFGADGALHTYPLAAKVSLNGSSVSAESVSGELTEAQLVRYKVNKDGEINRLNTETEEQGIYDYRTESPDILKRYRFSGDDTDTSIYYKITGYFVPYFTIDTDTKIFCVNEGSEDANKRYYMGSGLSFLANDEKVAENRIKAFNVNETGVAEAIVYVSESGSASVSEESSYGVVCDAKFGVDEDNEIVYELELYADDWYETYYIDTDEDFVENLSSGYGDGEVPFTEGDVIRYTADNFKHITNAVRDFDNRTQTVNYSAVEDNRILNYYYGDVYSINSTALAVAIGDIDGDKLYFPWDGSKCCLVNDRGTVRTASRSEIVSWMNDPGNQHKILIKSRYARIIEAIIYE